MKDIHNEIQFQIELKLFWIYILGQVNTVWVPCWFSSRLNRVGPMVDLEFKVLGAPTNERNYSGGSLVKLTTKIFLQNDM